MVSTAVFPDLETGGGAMPQEQQQRPVYASCTTCHGTGLCPRCGGSGSYTRGRCSVCGEGELGDGKCKVCSGVGTIRGACACCGGKGRRLLGILQCKNCLGTGRVVVFKAGSESASSSGMNGSLREPLLAPRGDRLDGCGRILSLAPELWIHRSFGIMFAVIFAQQWWIPLHGLLGFFRILFPLAFFCRPGAVTNFWGAFFIWRCIPIAWFLQVCVILVRPWCFLLYYCPKAVHDRSLEPIEKAQAWPIEPLGGGDYLLWRELLIGVGWTYLVYSTIKHWDSPRYRQLRQRLAHRQGGAVWRAMLLVTFAVRFSVPMAVTSSPVLACLAFLLRPWLQLAGALGVLNAALVPLPYGAFPDSCLGLLTITLTLLKVSWFIHRRQDPRRAEEHLNEVLQWVAAHPFHAQLEQEFGKARQSGATIGRSLSRAISATLSPEDTQGLEKKQKSMIQEQRASHKASGVQALIRRDHLWADSRDLLLNKTCPELLGEIKITYKEEAGVDYGGLSKDWFDNVAKYLAEGGPCEEASESGVASTSQPPPLLVPCEDGTLMPRPLGQTGGEANSEREQRLRDLIAAGRFIALATSHEMPLPLSLSLVTCKLLLNQPVGESDVRQLDPQFYRQRVEHVLKQDGLAEMALALGEPITFLSAPTELRPKPVELKPDGAQIIVTDANKQDYVQLLCEDFLCGGIRLEMQCVVQGFWELLPPALLAKHEINPRELSLMISGVQDLEPDLWQKHAAAVSGSPKVLEWFWQVVREMDLVDRCTLLHFCTGSSRLPPGGFADLKPPFKVEVAKKSGDPIETATRLPVSHTCFNQLILSEYQSKEQLLEKLRLALKESKDFGLV